MVEKEAETERKKALIGLCAWAGRGNITQGGQAAKRPQGGREGGMHLIPSGTFSDLKLSQGNSGVFQVGSRFVFCGLEILPTVHFHLK